MLKIKFVDNFGEYSAAKPTVEILTKLFGEVQFSDDPDFLFFSVGKGEHLNYTCPRIFWTGENIVPDFNVCDYAIGFNYMDFEDRYRRIPLYNFYLEDYDKAIKKHLDCKIDFNKKFCNFVYSNGERATSERERFFIELSKYKRVDSGGRYLNNIGGPVEDKLKFQKDYKFSIAFENASVSGYTTEKIIQAFAAGTIPIYYGSPRIAEEFNPKAFINCHDYASFDQVIEKVKQIDNDKDLYEAYIREPIFLEDRTNPLADYEEFLKYICSQTPEAAMRRSNVCWGKMLQEKKKDYYRVNNFFNKRTLTSRVINRIIKSSK